MLPRHRESEFPGPLANRTHWFQSSARAHAGPGRADIPLHGEPLAEMHANRRVRCPEFNRLRIDYWTQYTKFV